MAWSPTPATQTLTSLQGVITKYVLSPDDTEASALATEALNDGVARLNSRYWGWMLRSENVSLSASVSAYVLATNGAMKVRTVELLNSSAKPKSLLPYMDPKTFQGYYPDRSVDGEPAFYTSFNLINDGTITLSAPASAGFIATYPSMQVYPFRKVDYYATGTDTLTSLGGGGCDVEQFLIWNGCMYISTRYLMGNDPKIVLAARKASEAWDAIVRSDHINSDWD